MKYSGMTRWFATVLVCGLMLAHPPAQAVTPPHWKDSGFSVNANGMTLQNVLEEFGRVYGARIAYKLKDDVYVKGRLKAESGSEFLDRLAQPYKFRWFVYNDMLYIVPRDENASLRLEVGENAVQDAKAALIGLGLFDSRFGWGELPDEGTVMVSGPRAYVELVRDVLLPVEIKSPERGRHIMVFRLKYASATDRTITSRGQSEVIPGVKTILNNLLFGPQSAEKLPESHGKFDIASGKRSREGKYGKGDAREMGEGQFVSAKASRRDSGDGDERQGISKAGSREQRPRIEADPSLNAIMIYDDVAKRATYKSLIAELDVEPQQVEIEALIVDIDRSKLFELGVEWGVRRSNDNVFRINATKGESQGVELPLPGSTLLISNAARFYARLKALEGNGQARVLAKPTVLTLDNVAAVLDLSQTAYVPLVGERVADLADITAGTMLRVVPRIVREADATRVRLEVDIEDGSIGDNSTKSSNVTRSTISTQAIVDLQHTLMIGGYHTESLVKDQQKVPVLGEVPVFGNLFRNEAEKHSSRERLFLITPRLAGTTGTKASQLSRAARLGRQIVMEQNKLAGGEAGERETKRNAASPAAVAPAAPPAAKEPGALPSVPVPATRAPGPVALPKYPPPPPTKAIPRLPLRNVAWVTDAAPPASAPRVCMRPAKAPSAPVAPTVIF